MHKNSLFFPLALPLLLIFLFLPFLLAYVVLSVGYILGFSPLVTLFIYLSILFGSAVNIPLFKLKNERPLVEDKRTDFFGFSISFKRNKYIRVYLNLGGAIIPTIISFYLLTTLSKFEVYATLLATFIVIYVSYKNAKIIKGGGIRIPMIIPPLTAVLSSLATISLFNVPYSVLAKISFIAGVIGVLIGADLFNLRKIKKTGVNMVSIGGAGTFDGIFLTGVFAAIFSSLFVI